MDVIITEHRFDRTMYTTKDKFRTPEFFHMAIVNLARHGRITKVMKKIVFS